MAQNKKPESFLLTRVCNYMHTDHPKVPFRVDTGADVPLPIHIAKRFSMLHGKFSRGYPDIFIATCRGKFGGLYLELKATEEVVDSEHTRTQAQYHAVLRHNGYKVQFVCGFAECKKAIKQYLKLDKVKQKV